MRKIITVLALAATMLLASASMAIADVHHGPECDDGVHVGENHGAHITGYVKNGVNEGPGGDAKGGGPAHFGSPASPGASFCQGDNQAPALPAR